MWLFLKKKQSTVDEPERPKMRFKLLRSGLSVSMFRLENRVALKFWLPELVAEAIDELSRLQNVSMSAMLREFFMTHLYGVYPVTCLKLQTPECFKDIEVMFSISRSGYQKKRDPTYWVPELGKNVAPIKVWIPSELKRDLGILADHTGIPLSQYVREIVISRLLGHGTLPMRSEMFTEVPLPAADAWCDDKDVEMKQFFFGEGKLYANMRPEVRHDESGDDELEAG